MTKLLIGKLYRAKGFKKEWVLEYFDDDEVILAQNSYNFGWKSQNKIISKKQFLKKYELVP